MVSMERKISRVNKILRKIENDAKMDKYFRRLCKLRVNLNLLNSTKLEEKLRRLASHKSYGVIALYLCRKFERVRTPQASPEPPKFNTRIQVIEKPLFCRQPSPLVSENQSVHRNNRISLYDNDESTLAMRKVLAERSIQNYYEFMAEMESEPL